MATDNGNPANLVSFASNELKAYLGLALVIVRSKKGKAGTMKISATLPGLKEAAITIRAE